MEGKSITIWTALIVSLAISGCATNRNIIEEISSSTRTGIFSEMNSSDAQPGQAIMDIKFSVKSNSSYLAGTYYKHSNPPYLFYLNIDGQTIVLTDEPVLEDSSPVRHDLPESGIGWRYRFSKRLALSPGKHAIKIALPIDDVMLERNLDLRAGLNAITVTPVYNRDSLGPYRGQTFTAGVKALDLTINR
jgi:hypothetical protein